MIKSYSALPFEDHYRKLLLSPHLKWSSGSALEFKLFWMHRGCLYVNLYHVSTFGQSGVDFFQKSHDLTFEWYRDESWFAYVLYTLKLNILPERFSILSPFLWTYVFYLWRCISWGRRTEIKKNLIFSRSFKENILLISDESYSPRSFV